MEVIPDNKEQKAGSVMIWTHGCSITKIHRKSLLRLHCIMLLSLLLFTAATQADTIQLSQIDRQDFDPNAFLYFLPLDKKPLTQQQLLSLGEENFQHKSQQLPSPQLTPHRLYRLFLFNDSDTLKRLVLHINNPMIDAIELLQINQDNKIVKKALLGDLHRADFTLQNSLPNFAFELPANSEATLYIQVSTSVSTTVPITLHSEMSFQRHVYQSFLTWGAFIGVILMMVAYNTLLYFGNRNKIYLFYLGYIVTMLVQLGTIYGYGFHLFPFGLQSILQQNVIALNYLIAVFAILFALYFLRYDQDKAFLYRFSLTACAVLTLLGLASIFLPQQLGAKIYYPVQLLVYLLIARICLPKLFDGERWSSIYLFSWLPLFIGTTITQLQLLDKLPHHYLTQYALLFGVIIEIVIISIALTERFRTKQKERIYSVTHDFVTGLPNQILLTECIAQQMHSHNSFTLILFRAEKFSEIKPALGLIAANNMITAIIDNVLDYFSAMNNLYVFESDKHNDIRLSRINDDTFGLLLMGDHDEEELSYIILTIQEAVSTPINVGGYSVSTSCIVGSVSYPKFGINAEMVMQKAMHSLDLATKEDGKYAFYSNDTNVDIQAQLQLVAELQQAIDDDKLEIYHQVQIDLSRQSVCGNEALVRWNHPTRGFISPELFVGLAESTGLISQLTEWVISKSLEQHKEILDAGYRQNISINLSAKDLTQTGLIAHIMTTIADLDLDPTTIIFELTESATSDDPVHALNTINQLHELNVKVAIDDFGTGYSSLEYLSKLPFHELKVDKSFVLDILEQERNQAITKTTIEMAKNLGIFVVAEGIENEQIENMLTSFGCEIGQGYYYAKPLPVGDYLSWLGKDDNKYVKNAQPTGNEHYAEPLKVVH